jgi:hypothetical protein
MPTAYQLIEAAFLLSLLGLACLALLLLWAWAFSALSVTRSYKDKHVMVTGGSFGIGYDIAKAYLLRGAKVRFYDICIHT